MKSKMLSLSFMAVILLTLLQPGSVKGASATYCISTIPQIVGIHATARADNGDTIEMHDFGTSPFDPLDFSGSYVHKDPSGNIIDSGTWTAEKVVVFKFYGCDAEISWLLGGRGLFKIRLVASDGSVSNGYLDIESPVGNPPPGAIEGIRLTVKSGNLPSFKEPLGGFTIFELF